MTKRKSSETLHLQRMGRKPMHRVVKLAAGDEVWFCVCYPNEGWQAAAERLQRTRNWLSKLAEPPDVDWFPIGLERDEAYLLARVCQARHDLGRPLTSFIRENRS